MEGWLYTPGAGHMPPLLAGRDGLIRQWRLSLNGAGAVGRRGAEDLVLTGPRGVGKTAVLSAFATEARGHGFVVVEFQAATGQESLIDQLVGMTTARAAAEGGAWEHAKTVLDRLSVGVNAFGVSARLSSPDGGTGGVSVVRRDPGVVAAGLAMLATRVREGAAGRGGVAITLDEMQVARQDDLALLAAALHRLNVEYPQAAVVFAGTGLPHTSSVLARAGVTHPDRLFAEEAIPVTLDPGDAAVALTEPAASRGVVWHPDAVDLVVARSNGYPAHLQVMADATWARAPGPHAITRADAAVGTAHAAEVIARRSLGPRLQARSDRSTEYLAALAALGGEATVRQLEAVLDRPQRQFTRTRDTLIDEGDIYAPSRGVVTMAVPLMSPFVLRQYEHARSLAAHPDRLLPLRTLRERAQTVHTTTTATAIPPPLDLNSP